MFFPFYYLNQYFDNYFNLKNSRNIVSATHALSCVVLDGAYLFTGYGIFGIIAHQISLGYFAFDMYYMIRYEKINMLRCLYFYHHFASIYMIVNSHLLYNSHQLVFYGELSNLPSYVIYHYLHDDVKNTWTDFMINIFKKIQKIVYGIIRLPIMSYILINMIRTLDFSNPEVLKMVSIISPVYFMGLVWTFKLLSEK